MTSEFIAYIAGILITLATLWLPKFNTWFAKVKDSYKPLVIIGFDVAAMGLIFGWGCLMTVVPLGYVTGIACSTAGLLTLAKLTIECILAGQGAYLLGKNKATDLKVKVEQELLAKRSDEMVKHQQDFYNQ